MDSGRSSRGAIGAAAIAQVALLAWIAGLGASGVAAAVAIGAILAATLGPTALRRAPEATVMLAVGGLGMTVGWWADLGFATAAAVATHAREPLDLVWCWSHPGPDSLTALPSLSHTLSLMNLGMLALGMPAVAAARQRAGRGDAHGIAALVACAAAMWIGMSAGSRGAEAIAPALGASGVVLADWALMCVGMLAGMAAVERALRWMAQIRDPRRAAFEAATIARRSTDDTARFATRRRCRAPRSSGRGVGKRRRTMDRPRVLPRTPDA